MIDYSIKEEYLLKGWIFKGTINFKNSIPTDIIHTDDFAIRIVNPVTFYAKTILNIPSSDNSDVEISSDDALIKDLGYGTTGEDEIHKIEANLVKNGGLAYFITEKSIVVYLMSSYKFNDVTVSSFDMAQITVTFRLNGTYETIKMDVGILPSVRRSNNFTVYKASPMAGGDSVFPDNKSRVINPEPDEADLAQTSGYNFNERYTDYEISTSANFMYNETVDGLYFGPQVTPTYEASAVIYTPVDDYKIEIASYLIDPYTDRKIDVPYEYDLSNIKTNAEEKIFDITPTEDQLEYYGDFFNNAQGDYYALYNSSAIKQILGPDLSESMKYRLTLECTVSDPDEDE